MDWFEVYQFQFFYQPFALSATAPTRVYLAATAAPNASVRYAAAPDWGSPPPAPPPQPPASDVEAPLVEKK